MSQPLGADIVGRGTAVDVGPARVLVALADGLVHLVHGHPGRLQALGVQGYFVLFEQPAKAAHVGHAGRTQQLPPHYPVLNGAQLAGVVLLFVARLGPHQVLVDLAQAGGNRRQLGPPDAGRNLAFGFQQPLADLLARPVNISFIFKNDGYDREAEARERAHLLAARNGGHALLDGKGHEPLDVAGC